MAVQAGLVAGVTEIDLQRRRVAGAAAAGSRRPSAGAGWRASVVLVAVLLDRINVGLQRSGPSRPHSAHGRAHHRRADVRRASRRRRSAGAATIASVRPRGSGRSICSDSSWCAWLHGMRIQPFFILPAAPNQFISRHSRSRIRARNIITKQLVAVMPSSLQISAVSNSSHSRIMKTRPRLAGS